MKQIILQTDEKRSIGLTLEKEKERLDVVLAGDRSEVDIFGLVLGQGVDEMSIEVFITHAAPNTKSNVNVRAVLPMISLTLSFASSSPRFGSILLPDFYLF